MINVSEAITEKYGLCGVTTARWYDLMFFQRFLGWSLLKSRFHGPVLADKVMRECYGLLSN